MRLPCLKIICIVLIVCVVLNILEAKRSKKSKKEHKNKQKQLKGRPYKSGTVPVEITEKTELDPDNIKQLWPEQNRTQSTLSDDRSKDSDEDDDDKKKKKAKPYQTTVRPTLRTTTEKVGPPQNVTEKVGAPQNVTANWATEAINITTPLNISRPYIRQGNGHFYHRPDTEGHKGDGRMPCAMGQSKFDKVEKDITALWGYVQGIAQPVHLHVHNEDGDIKVDRTPHGHSVKQSKLKKEREKKVKSSKHSKKGKKEDAQVTSEHLRHKHSKHDHDHNHSHHTTHNHSHHTAHNHIGHNHSNHHHTKDSHGRHHSRHRHNHTKHSHNHNHSHHHHSKHNDTHHVRPDPHHTNQPGDVIGQLGLSKLGKGRETHIHIHIHVDDKGNKQNKGDDHYKEEPHKSEKDEQTLYATCDLRNNDPKYNISGIISLRQKPGQQLEVSIQVRGFSIPPNADLLTPDDNTTLLANSSSADFNETYESSIPVFSQHGFHVHEYGDFSKGCLSFGGHFNPEGVTHGHRNGEDIGHVGDWGNIDVDANGQATSSFEVKSASLKGQNSIIGRGIVIHAREDDLGEGHTEASKTTGDAGGRIACCTVAWAKPQL